MSAKPVRMKSAGKPKAVAKRGVKRADASTDTSNNVSSTEDPKTVGTNEPNQEDVEEIGELINGDIETDEEWDDDDEGSDNEGYERFGESDAESGDDCAYTMTRRKRIGFNLDDIDDDDDDEEIADDDAPTAADGTIVAKEARITSPMITKYERVRLLTDRTTQLALGAKPMIRGIDEIGHFDREKMIAQLEFEARVIPLIIRRTRPDGAYEEWKLSELSYKEDMIVYGKDAFTDPTTLTIDPTYLKKRSGELQTGGNITGFSKVVPAFPLELRSVVPKVQSPLYPNLTPLRALVAKRS